jgi:hypothetical protein
MNRFKRYRHTPKGRYTRHKANAKRRGVAFELTFDEWLRIWFASTYWGVKGYSMNRYGDEGAYKRGNVYIGTVGKNTRDRNFKYGPPRATSAPRCTPAALDSH